MFLFQPNLENMKRKHDIIGLLKALKYPGQSQKAQQIRSDAAEYLCGYASHFIVLEILMNLLISGSLESSWRISDPIKYLLYPHYQNESELIEWWKSNKDKPDDVQKLLKSRKEYRRDDEWREVKGKIDNSIEPPARIRALIRANIDGDEISDAGEREIWTWSKEHEKNIAPALAKAKAELEAKWHAQDSIWEKEEVFLKNWIP